MDTVYSYILLVQGTALCLTFSDVRLYCLFLTLYLSSGDAKY